MRGIGNGWRRLRRQRVFLSLKTEGAIRGILFEARGGLLVLKDAELLTPGSDDPIPLDGDAIVSVDNVDFAQVLPALEVAPRAPARANPSSAHA